jgi:hypothetical protein
MQNVWFLYLLLNEISPSRPTNIGLVDIMTQSVYHLHGEFIAHGWAQKRCIDARLELEDSRKCRKKTLGVILVGSDQSSLRKKIVFSSFDKLGVAISSQELYSSASTCSSS